MDAKLFGYKDYTQCTSDKGSTISN